ncbi:MAG: hypothetical protein U9N42_00095 [Campylobacterota bacterium]|nr:hypothetical protein [Campylobacterota bacterium]
MYKLFNSALNIALLLVVANVAIYADIKQKEKEGVETIVIIRHAEKPKEGLGQLSIIGLKRSLLLPKFFKKNFQQAHYIFAPNPSVQHYENHGDKKFHCYIRPLATIEPTAITLGLPVNTMFGLNDTKELAITLLESKYHNSTIYIAWEHSNIINIAHTLMKKMQATNITIPKWKHSDFNTVFVFKINWNKPVGKQLEFQIMSENIHNLAKKKVSPSYLE